MHDWIDLALGVIVSSCGWLIVRLVGRLDMLEAKTESNSIDIRDTRAATEGARAKLGMAPYHYTH